MTFTFQNSNIRTIKQGDPNFNIQDGLVVSPRAGFEISRSCPKEYRTILLQAFEAGWLKPVANVTERELIFMGLSK
jgi:hypothetical protein